ncbi:MAG: hypothetical protein K2X87_09945, partial [Gemmataceae bacterium]|nr:hypothetical protein [Gemmataceae bacterium]
MTSSHPTPPPCHWFSGLAAALDPRSAPRMALLFVGAAPARGLGPAGPSAAGPADVPCPPAA